MSSTDIVLLCLVQTVLLPSTITGIILLCQVQTIIKKYRHSIVISSTDSINASSRDIELLSRTGKVLLCLMDV